MITVDDLVCFALLYQGQPEREVVLEKNIVNQD